MDDDTRLARIEFIRAAARMAPHAADHIDGVDARARLTKLFGVEPHRIFNENAYTWGDLLSDASELLPDNDHSEAILNALGMTDDYYDSNESWETRTPERYDEITKNRSLNLTGRRDMYVATHEGVSLRTLLRWEQKGAELLEHYMDVIIARRNRTVEGIGQSAEAFDAISRRVKDLESIVASLAHLAYGEELTEQQTKDEIAEWSARREYWDVTRTDD
jgi:hypothetical protein